MPVKRRVPKKRLHAITAEAVELFRLCLEIQETGCDEYWEADGGRRHEFLDANNGLNRLLGLKPWEASPVDVPDSGDCPWGGSDGNLYSASWPQAQEMRRALLKAVGGG